MNSRYGAVVFDEWAVVSLAENKARVMAYTGPRNDDFLKNFAKDLGSLRAELLGGKYGPGDFEFSRHGVGTGIEAFLVLGTSIYLMCNNTTQTMDAIAKNPRWLVAQDTFRPPWFHRNVMSELMGLVKGVYDAKAEGFVPGGISLHNCMLPHGPDAATFEKASAAELLPHRIDNTLAFMFESRHVFVPTAQALHAANLQGDYDQAWQGFAAPFAAGATIASE